MAAIRSIKVPVEIALDGGTTWEATAKQLAKNMIDLAVTLKRTYAALPHAPAESDIERILRAEADTPRDPNGHITTTAEVLAQLLNDLDQARAAAHDTRAVLADALRACAEGLTRQQTSTGQIGQPHPSHGDEVAAAMAHNIRSAAGDENLS